MLNGESARNVDHGACLREIFGTLSQAEFDRLQDAVRFIQRPKDNILYEEGDSAIEGYCICSGSVEIFKRTERGGALNLRTADATDLVGADEILAKHPTYRCSARALRDVQLIGIPREELLQLARSSSNVACALARQISSELIDLRNQHTSFVEKPLIDRLQIQLGKLADRYGIPIDGGRQIDLPLTNSDLAQLIGTTPGTVSMLLGDLKDKGIVHRKGQKFVLQDQPSDVSLVA